MKRLLIILILIIIVVSSVNTIAQETIDLSEPMLARLAQFGVDIENIDFIDCVELEPDEFKNFNEYREENIAFHKEYEDTWSTFWHGNVNTLDIKAKASSILKGYPITNILDKKLATAWVEGVNGDGIGEWFSLDIHAQRKRSPSGITLFGIIPGYLKSDKSWEENNRIKTALLVIKTIALSISDNEDDHYVILRLKLKDLKELQVFKVGRYQKYDSIDKKVWLIVEDVYKGTKYNDTCISEIYLKGAYEPDRP